MRRLRCIGHDTRSRRGKLSHGDAKDGTVSPGLGKGLSSGSLSDHVSEDSEHSGTAVVKLNVELAGLDLVIDDVLSEPSDSVVTTVVVGGQPGELDQAHEGEDLGEASGGDLRIVVMGLVFERRERVCCVLRVVSGDSRK